MSADGNERGGVKAPRTLFSLGRPGTKRPGADAGAGPEAAGPIGGAVDTADAPAEVTDGGGVQYACGACGALLPGQASFCGECGTPVAMDDDLDEDDGMLDELADLDAEPVASADDVVAPVADPESALDGVAGVEPVAVAAPATEPSPPGPTPTTEAWPPGPAGTPMDPVEASDEPPRFAPPAYVPQGPIPPAATSPIAEPAAVLFADPSIAEPLPTEPMGSFTVSEPMHGTAAGAEPLDHDATTVAPAVGEGALGGAAAVGAAAVGGAVVGDAIGGDAAPGAMSPPPAPPGTPQPATEADANFTGTTATSMPYGTGPVESSATRGRGPLIAAVVVVGILLIGAIAFALARGGSNDVATQPSTTQAPITTAKAPAKGSTSTSIASTSTTAAEESSTTTSLEDVTTTTAAATSSTATPSTSATPTTSGGSSNPTNPPVTTAGSGALNFQGPADFGIIRKGGQVSFTVTNVGNASGDFQCSANNLQLNPSAGTVAPNTTQQIIVVDFRRVEAAYSIQCLGAGGSRYNAKVTVGST